MEGLHIIRNNKQRDALIEHIRSLRLPFKSFNQLIYLDRSLEWNAYYWGVVVKMIHDATGQEPEKIHEEYKKKFNVDYYLSKAGKWVFRVKGTSEYNIKDFGDYVEKVVADATIEYRINFPWPNEVPVNDFGIIN